MTGTFELATTAWISAATAAGHQQVDVPTRLHHGRRAVTSEIVDGLHQRAIEPLRTQRPADHVERGGIGAFGGMTATQHGRIA